MNTSSPNEKSRLHFLIPEKESLGRFTLVMFLIWMFLMSVSIGMAQSNSSHQKSKQYALSLAKKYCSNAYEIISKEDAKTVAFWMDGKTSKVGPGDFATTVHECLHAYDHKLASEKGYNREQGYWYDAYFIDEGIIVYTPKFDVFATEKLHPKHISKDIRKAGRYKTYVTGKASSNGHGLFGLMEEFNAYHHGNRALLEMLEAGKQLTFMGEPSSGVRTNNISSYYEFNIFMAEYLRYAKRYEAKTYRKLMSNKSLRLAYTLIEVNFREVLSGIYATPERGHHFPCYNNEDQAFNSELRKIMNDFMLHGAELGKYERYVASKSYNPELIRKNRPKCGEESAFFSSSSNALSDSNDDDEAGDGDIFDWDNDYEPWSSEVDEDNFNENGSVNNNEDESEGEDSDSESFSMSVTSREVGFHYVVVETYDDFVEGAMDYMSTYQKEFPASGMFVDPNLKYYLFLGKYTNRADAISKAIKLKNRFRNVKVM